MRRIGSKGSRIAYTRFLHGIIAKVLGKGQGFDYGTVTFVFSGKEKR